MAQAWPDEAAGVEFADWRSALRFLAARSQNIRTLVVWDEFPYLVDSDPSLPSILQAGRQSRSSPTLRPRSSKRCAATIADNPAYRVGAWWGPGGEIDVVAHDLERRRVVIGECKWSAKAVA